MAAAAAQQMAPAEASPAALNAYGTAFRDYNLLETPRQRSVAAFYAEQHAKQTYAFVQAQKAKHLGLARREMGVWEAAGKRPLPSLSRVHVSGTFLRTRHADGAARRGRRRSPPLFQSC
jgi:hypothetical protein